MEGVLVVKLRGGKNDWGFESGGGNFWLIHNFTKKKRGGFDIVVRFSGREEGREKGGREGVSYYFLCVTYCYQIQNGKYSQLIID